MIGKPKMPAWQNIFWRSMKKSQRIVRKVPMGNCLSDQILRIRTNLAAVSRFKPSTATRLKAATQPFLLNPNRA
jgi:hypothetical protein